MNKFYLFIICICSFLQGIAQQTITVASQGFNPIFLSDGLIAPESNLDAAKLEIQGFKINLAQNRYGTLQDATYNSALLNLHATNDGIDLMKLRTSNPLSIFKVATASSGNFVMHVIQNGLTQLHLNSDGKVGIGAEATAAKLTINGTQISAGVFTGGAAGIARIQSTGYTTGDIVALDFGTAAAGISGNPLARIASEITNSGSYLKFGTSNGYDNGITNTALTINPAGYVGIGSTNPNSVLTVAKSNENADKYGYLTFSNLASGYGDWTVNKEAENNLSFSYGVNDGSPATYTPAITFKYGGYIGIGTTTPDAPLSIRNSGAATSTIRLEADANHYWDIWSIFNNSNPDLVFKNQSVEAFRLTASGNIGMGTTTPTQKLEVAGNIYSSGIIAVGPDIDWGKSTFTDPLKETRLAVNGTALFNKARVKLYGSWPDYVFNYDYKLPSLVELEKYIKENKHLPEIPSAAEVEKSGIDLGDNQALLLKKIEELTLLLIAQEKKIVTQSNAFEELQKQINALKK